MYMITKIRILTTNALNLFCAEYKSDVVVDVERMAYDW